MIQRNVLKRLTPEEMQLLQPELQAVAAGEAARATLGRYLQLIAGRADAVFEVDTGELYVPVEVAEDIGPHGVSESAAIIAEIGGALGEVREANERLDALHAEGSANAGT